MTTGVGPAGRPGRTSLAAAQDAVREIWSDVLHRTDVGPDDDFFDLNGTSLDAVRVVGRIRDRFEVSIKARDFFENPTVSALAARIADEGDEAVPPRLLRLAEPGSMLSFDQQRLWVDDQLRAAAAYNVHGRRHLVGKLDVGLLEDGIRTILRRHETLRSRFPAIDGRPVQVVDEPDDDWSLPVADLSSTDGDRLARAISLADKQAGAPFRLSHGPLFRALLVRIGPDEHLLAVTAHHIVCDDWSVNLFIHELSALYVPPDVEDEPPTALPELRATYRDYARWQHEMLEHSLVESQVSHWREVLDGIPAATMLPARKRLEPTDGAAARRVAAVLDQETTLALLERCRHAAVTPFMVILAALGTVLGRWTGQDDLVVGVPVTGRAEPGTGELIGYFGNTLPVRVRVDADADADALLAATRATALAAYAHPDVPLDFLVQSLHWPRDPRRTSLFQVILNVVDDLPDQRLRGLTTRELEQPVPPTKIDLTVNVRMSAGRTHLDLEFPTDRYEPVLMARFRDHLVRTLAAIVDDPAGPPARVALDPDQETVGTSAQIEPAPPDSRVAVATGRAAIGSWALTALASGRRERLSVLPPDVGHDPGAVMSWLVQTRPDVLVVGPPLLRALLALRPAPSWPASSRVVVAHDGDLLTHDVEALRAMVPGALVQCVFDVDGDAGPALVHEPTPLGAEPGSPTSAARAPERVPLGRAVAGADGEAHARLAAGGAADVAVGEVADLRCHGVDHDERARADPSGVVHLLESSRPGADRPTIELVAALRDHPLVDDALVVDVGTPEAVAYVAVGGAAVTVAALHAHLRGMLPAAAVPPRVVLLDALPLTPHGEYDHDRVPPLPPLHEEPGEEPATDMERTVAGIVAELLDLDRVGRQDSFFDLGGFSLLAVQLVSRIRSRCHVDLPLRSVFQAPTVELLSQLVVQEQARAAGDELDSLLAGLGDDADPAR